VSWGKKGRSETAYLYPIAETKQDQRLERYVQMHVYCKFENRYTAKRHEMDVFDYPNAIPF